MINNIMKHTKYFIFAVLLLVTQELSAQLKASGSPTPCYNNTGTAFISNYGVASPPFIINWSNGASTASIDHLKPGKYTVNVTDSRLCKGTSSYEVKRLKGGLSVSLTPAPNSRFDYPCGTPNPSITLIANAEGGLGTITYQPGKTQIAKGNGTYRVKARDAEGFCTGSAECTITFTPSICAKDPNEIRGPEGFGNARYVASSLRMPYTIMFENDPEFASAPAQKVVVTHSFDSHVNRSSLKLGDFGFNNMFFSVPPNTSSYSTRIDLRDSLGFFVDVTAGINVGNNTAFWILQTIDPATGLPPFDPTIGFLPINDSTNKGEGFVSYTVIPKLTTQSGDTIKASASIVFDINAPIMTNTWVNVADAANPVSNVNPLNASYPSPTIMLNISATDEVLGSGIANVELWTSENEGPYSLYGSFPPDTIIEFTGQPCSSYRFFSIATDNTGNTEDDKEVPDTYTSLMPKPVITVQAADLAVAVDSDTSFSILADGATIYQWEVSTDGGITFTPLVNVSPYAGVTTASLQISNTPLNLNGNYYRCLAGNGFCSTYSQAANLLILSTLSGRIRYDNSLESPLSYSQVFLNDFSMNHLDSTLSNGGGNFLFLDAAPGSYLVNTEITKSWGGVNATDALRTLLHFAGLNTLSGHRLKAANVNNTGGVNAVDALLIARRFTGLINSFAAGDWYGTVDTVSLGIGNVTLNKSVLCYGDVDGSFIPSLRTAPRVALTYSKKSQQIVSGEIFEIPLVSTQEFNAGAISLVMTYPENLFHIEDVRLKNPAHARNLMFTAIDGVLRIAWYSTEGLQIDFNDPLLFVKIRASEGSLIGKLSFGIESLSEICDYKGDVLENLVLEIPEIASAESADALTLAQNFPNPFRSTTEINYYLPEAGKVSLKVFNPLGQLIATLVEEPQQQGHFAYTFNEPSNMAGVFALQLLFENQNGKKVLYKLMTKAH